MSYSYEKGKKFWRVVENPSGLVLVDNIGKNKAKSISRSLNLGSGFRGKTPEFFCIKYKKEKEGSQA